MNILILSITKNIIPYVKELRELAGSVTACILMQQLDYWFSKYPQGFYKFIEPCNHPSYRRGDSWCEELGFSDNEYRSAYEKIGIRYKSKREYSATTDKFQNKFYACYHDRIKNQIFYVRNHDLVESVLLELISTKKQINTAPQGSPITVTQHSRLTVNQLSGVTVSQSIEDTVAQPFQNTEGDSLAVGKPTNPTSIYRTDTTTENKTDISLLSLETPLMEITPEREMLNIWNRIVEEGREPVKLTPGRGLLLQETLKSHFNNNLKDWETFCALITSSKFLMGEVTPFRVSLNWVLKPEIISNIKEEHSYNLGDRKPIVEKKKELTTEQKESLETTRLKEDMQHKLDKIHTEARNHRRKDLESLESTMAPEEITEMKEEFVRKFNNGELPEAKSEEVRGYFKEMGWTMPGAEVFFREFKQNKLLPALEEYYQQTNTTLGYHIPDVGIKIKEMLNAPRH